MRIEISEDEFKALIRLSDKLTDNDIDAIVFKGIIERKKTSIKEHNLKTIEYTHKDAETRKMAKKIYLESRSSRY